jgi:hypothetical protein
MLALQSATGWTINHSLDLPLNHTTSGPFHNLDVSRLSETTGVYLVLGIESSIPLGYQAEFSPVTKQLSMMSI